MMQTLAEGWWCVKCEVFEDDDTSQPIYDSEQCLNCGCDGSDHSRVEVVAKGME